MLQLFQWLPLATFNDDSRSQFPCLMWFIKQKYGLMIISGVYSRVSMHGGWYLEAFFMPEILFAYQRKQTHLHTHTHQVVILWFQQYIQVRRAFSANQCFFFISMQGNRFFFFSHTDFAGKYAHFIWFNHFPYDFMALQMHHNFIVDVIRLWSWCTHARKPTNTLWFRFGQRDGQKKIGLWNV